MDPRIAFHTLQNYRHRGPLIVAMEPDPIPEGLGRWEKAAEPLTQAGAGLFVWTPAGARLRWLRWPRRALPFGSWMPIWNPGRA